MKFPKRILAPLAAVVAMSAPGAAVAAYSGVFNFGDLLTGTGPSSATFAQLSISSLDDKNYDFDLKIGNNLNSVFYGNTGTFVSSLRVDTTSNDDPTSSEIFLGSWGVAEVRLNTSTSNSGGINWDFIDSFCGSGNACNPNDAASRLTQGEEVKWTTTFADAQGSQPFENPGFLLKVQGYTIPGTSGTTSAEYVPLNPIPEPETYAMLLAGLGLLGLAMRRRKQSALAA